MSDRLRPQRESESATTDGDVPVGVAVDPPADVAPELTERPRDRGKWTVGSSTEVGSR